MSYANWKVTVQGQHLDVDKSGDFDCVDVPKSWAQYLFPGVSWVTSVGYGNAKDLFAGASSTYFTKIPNDTSHPSQLPQQGDVLVCGPTPASGYTNTFNNPYGHTGVVDSANSSGYTIMSQASNTGEACEPRYNDWMYRPVIGWLRPKVNLNGGNDMFPNKGDLININNETGWPGHVPNDNDLAYWTTGTSNPGWSKGADQVWKDLMYGVIQYVQAHPQNSSVSKQSVVDYINGHLS